MQKLFNRMPLAVKVSTVFLGFVWVGWMLFWIATAQFAVVLGWLTGLTIAAGVVLGIWAFIELIEWLTD